VEVNKREVVRILGIVYRTTGDLGIDAALMEATHSGPVPRSPGGVAQYVLIRTVELYNAPPASVTGVFQAMGGTGKDDGNAVAVTGTGLPVVAGNFSGTASFATGPGVGDVITLSTTDDSQDVFVAGMNAAGTYFTWARRAGGPGNAVAYSVAVVGADTAHDE
jgi:hypothetical protein